jgi:hypothetical protein
MGAIIYLLRGVLAVLGTVVGRLLGARGDIDNKRRDFRVHVLVDAWRNIERAVSRPGADETRGLEQALADVQLFGTPSQAEHAARVARSMNEGDAKTSCLDELLEVLRLDLRKEMRLRRAESPLVCLRAGVQSAMMPSGEKKFPEVSIPLGIARATRSFLQRRRSACSASPTASARPRPACNNGTCGHSRCAACTAGHPVHGPNVSFTYTPPKNTPYPSADTGGELHVLTPGTGLI